MKCALLAKGNRQYSLERNLLTWSHGDSELKNVACLSMNWKKARWIAASHVLWQEMKTKESLCHDAKTCHGLWQYFYPHLGTTDWQKILLKNKITRKLHSKHTKKYKKSTARKGDLSFFLFFIVWFFSQPLFKCWRKRPILETSVFFVERCSALEMQLYQLHESHFFT